MGVCVGWYNIRFLGFTFAWMRTVSGLCGVWVSMCWGMVLWNLLW